MTTEKVERTQVRFRELVESIGDERGRAAGWKRAIAQELGFSPGHLSRVLTGKRRVGHDILQKAAEVYSLSAEFFTEEHAGRLAAYRNPKVRSTSSPEVPSPHSVTGPRSDRDLLLEYAAEMIKSYSETRTVPAGAADAMAFVLSSLRAVETVAAYRDSPGAENAAHAVTMAVAVQALLLGPPLTKDGRGA